MRHHEVARTPHTSARRRPQRGTSTVTVSAVAIREAPAVDHHLGDPGGGLEPGLGARARLLAGVVVRRRVLAELSAVGGEDAPAVGACRSGVS